MRTPNVKFYSITGKTPEYKTSGASGFDLSVIYTDKTCKYLSKLQVELIENIDFNSTEFTPQTLLLELFDNIDESLEAVIMTPHMYILSVYDAIYNKLEEINKNDNIRYTYFVKYMEDKGIENINIITPFSHNILPTGISVEIPEGYEIQIRPRSGIGAKTNMIAHFGTIDSDYRGDIGIIINNPSFNSYVVLEGERLAQGVFTEVYQCTFERVETVEELSLTKRGSGGYGSTGKI